MRHDQKWMWVTGAFIAVGVWFGFAYGKAGVQITPDGKRTLVSKDVGTERWAITLNSNDGNVTGNVFQADGGPPSFVSCDETTRSEGTVTYRCHGADRCPLPPCGPAEWAFIAEPTLQEEFFLPPLEFTIELDGEVERAQAETEGDAPSGVQVAPDGERTLISKDVGPERWAITLNDDDGSVTGNVFFPDGSDPAFVWCEEKRREADERELSCFGSDRCVLAPCPRSDWTFIADVTLPTSFFSPPAQTSLDDVIDSLVADLGENDAFVAIVIALDKGYSVRQIWRAALSGRLAASGDVVERSGDVEAPDGPPLGLFAESASGLGTGLATLPSPQDLRDQFADALGEEAKAKALVRLLDRGFSLNQVGQIARGEVQVVDCNQAATPQAFRECVEKYGGTMALVHPDGRILDPEKDSEDLLTPEGKEPCGNGRIDPGEQCDGPALGGETCITRGFAGGELRCNELCEFDTSRCRDEEKCGDGIADRFEHCDGADLKGQECPDVNPDFVGGRLLCNSGCNFDVSQCLVESSCGNGMIDKAGGLALENCDGPDLGGMRCSDFVPYVAGILRCTAACEFDLSECKEYGNTDCGNGKAEGHEHCDRRDLRGLNCVTAGESLRVGPYVSGELGCDTECHYVFDSCRSDEECKNDVAEGNEECDGSDLRGHTCQSLGQTHPDGPFSGGSLRCEDCHFIVNDCIRADQCGDGVRDRWEACDREDFGGDTCESLLQKGGNLICTANCEIDPRSCEREQRCGDDFGEGTEQCDGVDHRGQTCESLGFEGGDLKCGGDCRFDTSRCFEIECGDDRAEGDEQCDGPDLRGADCQKLDFTGGGTLACGSDCRFDTSGCLDGPECGDGVAEGDEDCDGDDLRHTTCEDFDFEGGGTLRCFNSCQFDTSLCLEEPPCTTLLCPDGTCVPDGADCCGGGAWCEPGYTCVDGGCCPNERPELCAGLYCMAAGGDCCGSSGWCNPGWVCAGAGCCPENTPVPCADGTCCPFGSTCLGNGRCS